MEASIFVVIILIAIAVSALIVGVSNDAVNFLNSAIGARVAPRYIIMIIASIGILVGVLFSGGMMEVARKGIFHPELFYFQELMTIFLAVMITNLILIDFYNTFGLPTSTTVAIVFELLGAAVAVSLIKLSSKGESLVELINYINTSKALAIISGILLSVVVAFTVGVIVQFFARLVFTFNYEKQIKKYGAIWGGISLTAITFFILIKGAKSASFIDADIKEWIIQNVQILILYSFVAWAIVFQILIFLKVNIFKPIVLVGTFALALAFAANDLVNFIGVPIAGLNAYQFIADISDPSEILMVAMKGKIESQTFILILAGLLMIATLWLNRKSRSVLKTSLDLGRQSEGIERFESSALSRAIVRMNISLFRVMDKVIPKFVQKAINKRFVGSEIIPTDEKGNLLAFDLVRASVTLIVASILISFATSWKLPLSTTYVTFMVAMGTSLSDKAWGRDSAVYRINGVLTVIGGWFFTAFMAFLVAAIFAVIIYYGEIFAIVALVLLAAYFIYRSHYYHKEESFEEEEINDEDDNISVTGFSTLIKCMNSTEKYLKVVSSTMSSTFVSFCEGDREKLKKNKAQLKKIKKLSNNIVAYVIDAVRSLDEDEMKKGKRYGKIMGSIQEIAINVRNFVEKLYDHIDNNHRPPTEEQVTELNKLNDALTQQFDEAQKYLKSLISLSGYSDSASALNELIQSLDENQVARLRQKSRSVSTRGSLLFLDVLSDVDNITNHTANLLAVCHKNYISYQKDS